MYFYTVVHKARCCSPDSDQAIGGSSGVPSDVLVDMGNAHTRYSGTVPCTIMPETHSDVLVDMGNAHTRYQILGYCTIMPETHSDVLVDRAISSPQLFTNPRA